jgi:predicted NBD/HSP70 family sugar kinase
LTAASLTASTARLRSRTVQPRRSGLAEIAGESLAFAQHTAGEGLFAEDGVGGGAGDIGHIRLHDCPDALCMCGSYGCLAAVASGRALAGQLSDVGIGTASVSGVRDRLAAGQPDAVRLAREAGRRAGEVLVTVVTVLNPGVLMVAGDLAGAPFLTGVRELLYQRAMPRTTAHLSVVTSGLGERAGLLGAAAMVVEDLYSPDRADARLAALDGGRAPS